MNSFQETKQMMESFLKPEHIANTRYKDQYTYYNQSSPITKKKSEVYRVFGTKHMFLERVYSIKNINLDDFAILKEDKYYVFKGCCDVQKANLGMFFLLEMLKTSQYSFEFLEYKPFCRKLTFKEEKKDTNDVPKDAFPILSTEVNDTLKIVCDKNISKKACKYFLNIITYKDDAYIYTKAAADIRTEVKIQNKVRKLTSCSRIYFEYKGRETVLFKSYFRDFFVWKGYINLMVNDISGFFNSKCEVKDQHIICNFCIIIRKVYVWINSSFVRYKSKWLYDDQIYYIKLKKDKTRNRANGSVYPYQAILMSNNTAKISSVAETAENRFKLKANILNASNNLDFLIQNNKFYVQKSKKPSAIFMVYYLNSYKIKEVNKEYVNNLNTYVYTFHGSYYIWKGDASTEDELNTAKNFVEAQSDNYFIVDTNQFLELIYMNNIITYNVPCKIEKKEAKIFGFCKDIILPLTDINLDENQYNAFIIDFQSFVILIKIKKMQKTTLKRYAEIYTELEKSCGSYEAIKKPIYFLQNGCYSAFVSYFMEPKIKFCMICFFKPDELVLIDN